MKTLLAALALAATAQAHPTEPHALTDPPNVLLIVIDDWSWTERSRLTSLDDLAAQGVTMRRFITEPVCTPTRYAMLTGRYPRRDGVGSIVDPFDPTMTDPLASSPSPDRRVVYLAEALKDTHRTALVGKWHIGYASVGNGVHLLAGNVPETGPFVAGFDEWLAGSPSSIGRGPGASSYTNWYRVDNQTVGLSSVYATDAQADAFIAWEAAQTAPWFCELAFNAPHTPYDTPPGMSTVTPLRDKYLQGVDYLDTRLDDVLDAVDLSNTIVMVLGDNGTPNGVRAAGTPSGVWKGSTYGHSSTFGGGTCTPFIAAGPGIYQDVVSDRLVSVVDIPATLFEMIDLAGSRGFDDSVSFADELGFWTGAPAREFVFTEHYGAKFTLTPVQPGYDDIAVIEPNWKLRSWDPDGAGATAAQMKLYDLVNDPFEQSPIDPATNTTVRDRLLGHLATIPARL